MQKKGISLVALVITIIVLIILTVAVIMLIGGENGIIERGKKAVEANNKATATEKVLLEVSNIKMESTALDESFLDYLYNETTGIIRREELEEKGIESPDVRPRNEIEFIVDGEYVIKTDVKGNIKQTEKIHNLGTAINSERYGDKINYNKELTTLTGHIDGWKIFFEDTEYIYIITADYLDGSLLPNGPDELNMCTFEGSPYSASWASQADLRSIGAGSISKSRAKCFGLTWVESNSNSINGNSRVVADFFDNSWTKEFGKGIAGMTCSAIGTPTVEMYVKSWNAKGYTKMYCNNYTTIGYYVGRNNIPTTTYASGSETSGYVDTLYYPHTSVFMNCQGYWLAAPAVFATANVMYVDYHGNVGYNDRYADGTTYGIRPVVAIPKTETVLSLTMVGEDRVWNIVKK